MTCKQTFGATLRLLLSNLISGPTALLLWVIGDNGQCHCQRPLTSQEQTNFTYKDWRDEPFYNFAAQRRRCASATRWRPSGVFGPVRARRGSFIAKDRAAGTLPIARCVASDHDLRGLKVSFIDGYSTWPAAATATTAWDAAVDAQTMVAPAQFYRWQAWRNSQ